MEATELILVTTSTATQEEAHAIAKAVLEKRLAASAQIESGVRSSFWWKGEIREDVEEWRCTLKTRADLFESVKGVILIHHSYETPAIQAIAAAAASVSYLEWLSAETRPL